MPVSDLPDHLGYLLRQLSNHVSLAFAQKLAKRGVTVAEWAMLRVLYGHDPLAPSAVAARMGITRGAVSKLAERLIAKCFVEREADATDGRAQTLRLTRSGAALVPELAALADANEADCFGCLATDERSALRATLEKAIARLDLSTVPMK